MRVILLLFLSLGLTISSCSSGGGTCLNADDCQADESCINQLCQKKSCNECIISDTRCIGDRVQTCISTKNGCSTWGSETSCFGGQKCIGKNCVTPQSGEGQVCTNTKPCQDGLICVQPPGDPNSLCSRRCVKSSDCSSGQACFPLKNGSQACTRPFEPPVDALCKVKVERATISGGCWDIGCGAPDPFVVVKIGSFELSTKVKQDSFNPTWNETTNKSFSYREIGTSMKITLMDEDLSSNDKMIEWTHEQARWNLVNYPRGKAFDLKSVDSSINLRISISCSF